MPTELQGFNATTLEEKLLSISFIKKSEGIRFSKIEHAKYPELLYEAANRINGEYKIKSDRLIILATSGLPFGSVLSQSLELPTHYYLRHGWRVTEDSKESIYNILPSIPEYTGVTLIDSHSRRRNTAKTCFEIIKNTNLSISVDGLITLIGLDHFENIGSTLSFPEYSLISLSKHRDYLANILSDREPEEFFKNELKQDSIVWKELWRPTEISNSKNLAARMKNLIDNPSEYPLPTIISPHLRDFFPDISDFMDDKRIWNIFSHPKILKKIGQIISGSGLLNEFDVIVGCQAIGSVLSWVMAYHSNYKNPVLSCYDPTKIVPFPDNLLQNKKVLLVQGRIITGLETEGVVNRIEKSGGKCECILSLFWMPEQKNIDRCAPLRRLKRYGLNFITLAL